MTQKTGKARTYKALQPLSTAEREHNYQTSRKAGKRQRKLTALRTERQARLLALQAANAQPLRASRKRDEAIACMRSYAALDALALCVELEELL